MQTMQVFAERVTYFKLSFIKFPGTGYKYTLFHKYQHDNHQNFLNMFHYASIMVYGFPCLLHQKNMPA